MLRYTLAASMLLATPVMADDYPPGPGTTGAIAYERGVATGVIDYPGDVDAFAVQTALDGRSFAFVVQTACRHKVVRFYDANMVLLRESWPGGRPDQEAIVEWRPRYAGIHYLTVTDVPLQGYACPEPDSPAYTITSAESCSWGVGTVCNIQHGETKPGFLRSYGDRNWYRFEVKKHRYLMFDVDGFSEGSEPVITLRRANGAWMSDTLVDPIGNCIIGKACMMRDVCPGTYFIAVRDDTITQQVAFTVNMELIGWVQRNRPCP